MRVIASGNLTVELIRAQRFEVALHAKTLQDQPDQFDHCRVNQREEHPCQIDRVELSPEALACDPWTLPTDRADALIAPPIDAPSELQRETEEVEPEQITPVIGSPALAGLGVALVVPGTLLDVVA